MRVDGGGEHEGKTAESGTQHGFPVSLGCDDFDHDDLGFAVYLIVFDDYEEWVS